MKNKLTPKRIMNVLRSIKGVRLNKDNELQIKFDPPSTTFPNGWEPNCGYIQGSFTQQLLCLIEDGLNGDLETE